MYHHSAILFLNYNPLCVDSMKCKYCSAQSTNQELCVLSFLFILAFVTFPGSCCRYLYQEDRLHGVRLPKCVHCLLSPSIASCPTLGVQSGIFCVLVCISYLTNEIRLFINHYYFLCFAISCLHPY